MRASSGRWLKLSGCSFAAMAIFVAYLLCPIPDVLGPDVWRGIALVLIGMTGAVAGLMSHSWLRAVIAVVAGLISAVILTDDIVPGHEDRFSSDPLRLFRMVGWLGSEVASAIIAGSLGAAGTTVFSSRPNKLGTPSNL